MLSSLTAAVRIDQIGELLRSNDAALPDLDVGINRSRSDIGIGVPVIGRSGPEGTGVRHLPPGNTCVTGIGIDGADAQPTGGTGTLTRFSTLAQLMACGDPRQSG